MCCVEIYREKKKLLYYTFIFENCTAFFYIRVGKNLDRFIWSENYTLFFSWNNRVDFTKKIISICIRKISMYYYKSFIFSTFIHLCNYRSNFFEFFDNSLPLREKFFMWDNGGVVWEAKILNFGRENSKVYLRFISRWPSQYIP